MIFEFFGAKKKAIIAMAHIGALPGTPLYEADGGVDKLIDGVARDIENLQAGGVDAIMFGNENDRPYVFKATPETIAGMTAVIQAVKPMLKVPFGVNCLIIAVDYSRQSGLTTTCFYLKPMFSRADLIK